MNGSAGLVTALGKEEVVGTNGKTDTREMFPDWPWERWDRDQKEADRRRHERMSSAVPDWYDTPGGIALGWLVIGAVAAGVEVGLFGPRSLRC